MSGPQQPVPIKPLDRYSASMVYLELERFRWVAFTREGALDDHPAFPMVRALADYRARFEAAEIGLSPLLERDALAQAADYHEAARIMAWLYADALRNGFVYSGDLVGRAFLFHHRALVRRAEAKARRAERKSMADA